MNVLLQVSNLSVALHGREVLKDVSFNVQRGEVLGIVGTSGSGKSMTALALTGLLPLDAQWRGSLHLDGQAVCTDDLPRIRGRRIGLVFQEPATALNPLMQIIDQVAEAVRQHAPLSRVAARAQALSLLQRVGIAAPAIPPERYPHELSGGQRQRVAIAIALAGRPDLLIADEPTTALDVTTQAQILDLLAQLTRQEGLSTIFISHDLAVVAAIAHRVLVMNEGQIVEQGPIARILEAPTHDKTRRLIASHSPPARRSARSIGDAVLVAEQIVRSYRSDRSSHIALNKVSLTVSSGERVGIIGESGSGKSTLLRTLLGLESPQAGRILLGGAPVDLSDRARLNQQRRLVQAVFQDPVASLNPRHSVEKIVAEPLHLLHEAPPPERRRALVNAALAAVGLGGSALNARPHAFSGGQRQRLALARALIIDPKVLVLDEAVSALDSETRNEVLTLLLDLWESRGLGLLFVSHDVSVVSAITDRLVVIHRGEIVEQGVTSTLLSQPQHPYTQKLLAAAPSLAKGQTRPAEESL